MILCLSIIEHLGSHDLDDIWVILREKMRKLLNRFFQVVQGILVEENSLEESDLANSYSDSTRALNSS